MSNTLYQEYVLGGYMYIGNVWTKAYRDAYTIVCVIVSTKRVDFAQNMHLCYVLYK